MANSNREHSVKDDEITSVISSAQREKLYKYRNVRNQSARKEWHSDITFEPIPSDYTLLRLTELPKTGGDTLWASGYEVYDRISEPYQKFLEGLTATCAQPRFNEAARENDFTVHPGPRGAPENVGEELRAEHPLSGITDLFIMQRPGIMRALARVLVTVLPVLERDLISTLRALDDGRH